MDFNNYDLILAMDQNNMDSILRLSESDSIKAKVKRMREFDPLGSGDVPDPYYGGEKEFQEVFDILDRSIEQLLTQLKTKPI